MRRSSTESRTKARPRAQCQPVRISDQLVGVPGAIRHRIQAPQQIGRDGDRARPRTPRPSAGCSRCAYRVRTASSTPRRGRRHRRGPAPHQPVRVRSSRFPRHPGDDPSRAWWPVKMWLRPVRPANRRRPTRCSAHSTRGHRDTAVTVSDRPNTRIPVHSQMRRRPVRTASGPLQQVYPAG